MSYHTLLLGADVEYDSVEGRPHRGVIVECAHTSSGPVYTIADPGGSLVMARPEHVRVLNEISHQTLTKYLPRVAAKIADSQGTLFGG